jgi:hypothetical protein
MKNNELIEKLKYCAAQCDHCYYACKLEDPKESLEYCMMLDQDCADICRLTAAILERNSDNSNLFIKLCAEICELCAKECNKHAHMEHCKKCAEVCLECAKMCYQYPDL